MDAQMENDTIKALEARFWWNKKILPSLLPEVVGNMKKLRWISCSDCPTTSLPRKFQPMELCYLRWEGRNVKQLWEGNKHLPNLKVLDLGHCGNLVRTPDFEGLPSLERIILRYCANLKEIHLSIGRHGSVIYLDMEGCTSLEIFPPIIQMKKLETLLLSECNSLCKFPEIQTSMDNLVKLSLKNSGIEIVPSSVGRYCTNLVSLDLRDCLNLHSIEGNFRLLKHLKGLYLDRCDKLKNIRLLGFSRCLTRLSLGGCNLVDGDISSVLWEELSNLQALDLSGNKFSRLHSNLSQLPHLKFLNLSHCVNLVELPDLPSSIAILVAVGCHSLDIVGYFPANHLKWLWKVSLSTNNISGDGGRVVQSMLQGNAIEDYFISIYFGDDYLGEYIPIRGFAPGTFTLQLPWNWYSEFSGFLVYVDRFYHGWDNVITIKDVLGRENGDDVLKVSTNKTDDEEETTSAKVMWYISFGSLRNTSWWNSTHTTISFFFNKEASLKVELVPRRRSARDDSIERAKDATYHSNFWDEESPNKKTFEIISDSKSSIEIQWRHDLHADVFQ